MHQKAVILPAVGDIVLVEPHNPPVGADSERVRIGFAGGTGDHLEITDTALGKQKAMVTIGRRESQGRGTVAIPYDLAGRVDWSGSKI